MTIEQGIEKVLSPDAQASAQMTGVTYSESPVRLEKRMPEEKDNRWLLPFLATVRTRPAMFLGDERVHTLSVMLSGIEWGRSDAGAVGMTSEDEDLLDAFSAWLAKRMNYNLSGSTARWSALTEMLDDSPKNVHTFFRSFEEFLRSRGTPLDAVQPWTRKGHWELTESTRKRTPEDGQ